MRIKDKQIRPKNLLDEFKGFNFPKTTDKQLDAAKALLKSLVPYFSKETKITPRIKSFQQEILQIAKDSKKEVKKITIFVQGPESTYNKPMYIFTNGKVLHAYLNKEILECTFYDITVMKKKALNSKVDMIQLFTAIAITLATVIESIIEEDLPIITTLDEGLQLIQKIINTYENDHQQRVQEPIKELLRTIELYDQLDINYKDISKPNYPDSIQDTKKHPDQSYTEVVEHLEKVINQCITIGLFKKYQRSPNSNKKIENLPVICKGHTLLNNTKLLKKLNGSSLNAEGNLKKKHNFEAIDNKILELLKQDKFKNKYKSKNAAAEKIADEITKEIEVFMENDRDRNNHNQHIKLENLPTRILKLINKNPDLHEHLINK